MAADALKARWADSACCRIWGYRRPWDRSVQALDTPTLQQRTEAVCGVPAINLSRDEAIMTDYSDVPRHVLA